jgi:hypothetical protein
MKIKYNALLLICFAFFFSLQSLCMFKERQSNVFTEMCPDVFNMLVMKLDFKSHMSLLMTSYLLHSSFLKQYLNADEYMDEMIKYACSSDMQSFQQIMNHEGPRNQHNREEVENFFKEFSRTKNLTTADMYKQKYINKDLSCFSNYNRDNQEQFIKEIVTKYPMALKLILKQGYEYDFKSACDTDGDPLLYGAVFMEDLTYAKNLLLFDVDPNLINKEKKRPQGGNQLVKFGERPQGGTPLLGAVWNGNLKMVELLLKDKRVNPNIANEFGLAVLFSKYQPDKWIPIADCLLKDSRVFNIDIKDQARKELLKNKRREKDKLEQDKIIAFQSFLKDFIKKEDQEHREWLEQERKNKTCQPTFIFDNYRETARFDTNALKKAAKFNVSALITKQRERIENRS